MRLLSILRMALRSINRNKLRSILTMLGIVIGVAAVIAMLAIGQGARNAINSQIASLGTNLLMIFPGAYTAGGVRSEAGTASRLSEDDANAIKAQCQAVMYSTPMARTSVQVKAGGQNWRTTIFGAFSNYLKVRDWDLATGTNYTDADERGATKVCILGQTVITNIFGQGANPLGQIIRIKNLPFTVIGTLIAKGQNAGGMDQDDCIIAPYSTVQKKLIGSVYAGNLLASAVTTEATEEARQEINQTLMNRRKGSQGDGYDYTIRTQTDISNAANQTAQTLSILLASIALVSLLVGGIGIMNIMLVSVTERTREIGIRMAVGAKGSDVLLQFLVEALVLSFIGGIIGMIGGAGASWVISKSQGWPIAISGWSLLLGFGFSAATGIFFGWYPASKASALNPIDALRYE
jgi:putative ABC transport system permease protein